MIRRVIAATVLAVILCGPVSASATDRVAVDCEEGSVEDQFALAVAGDRVMIPAGTCSWTSGLQWLPVPANITIQCAGVGQTIIVDDFASSTALLRLFPPTTGTFRITGCEFRGGAPGANIKTGGVLSIASETSARISARVDHMKFDVSTYTNPGRSGDCMSVAGVYGVIDHNTFIEGGNCIRFYNAEAHTAWSEATGLGTNAFTFVEDNTFTNTGIANDCQSGGKMVWRYNTFTNTGIQTHATGGTGARGCRAWEIYGNTFTDNTEAAYQTVFWASGGTGVVWGNTTTGDPGYKNFIQLFAYRRTSATNTAQPTPTGFGYCGPARASGTVNVSSGAGTTITLASGDNFSTTNWPDDSMIIINGSSFKIVSVASTTSLTIAQRAASDQPGGLGPDPSTIAGLTGVAYSVGSNWDGNTDAVTGWPCIDTPGSGQGDLITGVSPNMTNDATSCIASQACASLRQAREPVYEWDNPFTPASCCAGEQVSVDHPTTLVNNRDYYKYTASFTGASGVGSGLRSARPATCTAGVAHWSTDQGINWKTKDPATGADHPAVDGTLDVCTATDTWTNAVYTPYAYPHDLNVSESSVLAGPSLRLLLR